MPAWLTAFIAACWAVIGPLVNALLAFQAGKYAQRQKSRADAAEASLDEIARADEAAAASRGWSPDDRMRYLNQRGRVRDLH